MQLFDPPIPFLKMIWPTEPGPEMFEVKCPTHPWTRYLTKGPWRSVHYCPEPQDMFKEECSCPLSTMEVIGRD